MSARPTSRLAAVRASNYLAFGGLQTVDLQVRPLTLIFGRNSSGKTALMRLIRLAVRAIARPVADDSDGRDLRPGSRHLPMKVDDVLIAATFRDLVHGRFSKEMGIGLDIEVNGAISGYDVALLPADASGDRSWLLRFDGRGPDEHLKLELDLAATLDAQRAVYRGADNLTFEGIIPTDRLEYLRRGARALDAVISHLGPLRARVPNAISRVADASLGYDGAGAPQLIAEDDELAARVDDWYAQNLEGCRLEVRPLLDTVFELTTTGSGGTIVNLAQAGEGLHQMLPIVVQQMAHLNNGNPFHMLDLVEQPELHLHDRVHAPLGDLFIATASLGRGAVIVETHSEGLLLRVRRRVAEGTFDPMNLAIYFVDRDSSGSYIRPIEVDKDGGLSEWPEGVFLESYHEVVAIQRALRSR